jgi:hypothetical protein
MIVKLRFPSGRKVRKTSCKNRHVALATAALMTPATLMMFVMAMWRIGADVGIATEFPITEGVWQHWQMWIAAAGISHMVSVLLNRYGRDGEMGVGKSVAHGLSVLAARQPVDRPQRSEQPASQQSQGD